VRHFLSTVDYSREELQGLLDTASELKSAPVSRALAGRTVALLFLNPSLRTRTSFEVGAFQLGAHAVVLAPGKGAWGIEFEKSTVTPTPKSTSLKSRACFHATATRSRCELSRCPPTGRSTARIE